MEMLQPLVSEASICSGGATEMIDRGVTRRSERVDKGSEAPGRLGNAALKLAQESFRLR